jgi:hypothetical protein
MTNLRDGSPLDVRAAIKVGDLIVTTVRGVAMLALGAYHHRISCTRLRGNKR